MSKIAGPHGKKRVKNERYYRLLIQDVVSGNIRPGERLGEERLASQWGVGRSVVRETLFRLEQDGLVERKPKSGTFVREIADEELLEIYDVRSVLEGLICRRVAETATDEELDELARIAEQTDSVEDETEERMATDFDFHNRLCECSRMRYVKRVLRVTHLHAQCSRLNQRLIYMRGFVKQPVPAPDHRDVVESLRRRDPNAAEKVMREHLQAARRGAIADMERVRARLNHIQNSLA